MPAKTPLTTTSSANYIEPLRGVHGSGSRSNVVSTREGLKHHIYFFSDIDDTDTWASGLSGIVMWAIHSVAATEGLQASVSGSTFTFAAFDASGAASNAAAYLHVWTRQ